MLITNPGFSQVLGRKTLNKRFGDEGYKTWPEGFSFDPKTEGYRVKLWAPAATAVEIDKVSPKNAPKLSSITGDQFTAQEQRDNLKSRLEGMEALPLVPQGDGYFTLDNTRALKAGDKLVFKLTDPSGGSHYQTSLRARRLPEDVLGPQQLVDLNPKHEFNWTDSHFIPAWKANPNNPDDYSVDVNQAILYQLHLGTFTPEGSYKAATKKLDYIKDLGVNTIQLLPLMEFPGRFGWSYDTTRLFAPESTYGEPDELKAFINKAHNKGIAVILDIVYNHLGPERDDYEQFDPGYVGDNGLWGKGINAAKGSPYNRLIRDSLLYWVNEFHVDGFRLDATHAIKPNSNDPYRFLEPDRYQRQLMQNMVALPNRVKRPLYIVAERIPPDPQPMLDSKNQYTHYDFQFPVALTSALANAYNKPSYQQYSDHLKQVAAMTKSLESSIQTNNELPYQRYTQCHDTIRDLRGRFAEQFMPDQARALSLLPLMLPGPVMSFQGTEFGSQDHWDWFADYRSPEIRENIINSGQGTALKPETFEQGKLTWSFNKTQQQTLKLFKQLTQLRQGYPLLKEGKVVNYQQVDPEHPLSFTYQLASDQESAPDLTVAVNLSPTQQKVANPIIAPEHWEGLFNSNISSGKPSNSNSTSLSDWLLTPGEIRIYASPNAKKSHS